MVLNGGRSKKDGGMWLLVNVKSVLLAVNAEARYLRQSRG